MIKIDFIYRVLRYHIPSFFRFKIFGKFFKNYKTKKFLLVGKNTSFSKNFKCGECGHIGHSSYIGPNVELGNFVLISDHVNIIGNDHVYDIPGTPITLSGRPNDYLTLKTIIKDDVWIGHGVTIMRGITIGEGSIIASNSVVTKNIPEYSIYAGIPAKFIKRRFEKEKDLEKHKNFLMKFREGDLLLMHDNEPIFKKTKKTK